MPDAPKAKIAVRCACGTTLAVPASAVGKNAKCPKCGKVFPITAPAKAAAPPGPSKAEEQADSLLEALARQEQTAEATSPPPESRIQTPCPQCKTMIPADSKVCVACGYNVETGRTIKGARTQAPVTVKAAKFAGRLTLGTALSALGALVGAGIWFGIAAATDYEIGYIAWAVGLLAGLGMKLGYQKESTVAGLVAAGMSIVGIMAAKVMYFAYVFSPILSYDPNSTEAQRDLVTSLVADQLYEQHEATSNGAPAPTSQSDPDAEMDDDVEDPAYTAAFEQAEKQVAGMSDAEVRQRAEEFHRQHPVSPAERNRAVSQGLLFMFILVCFNLIDILFFLLAVGTAYKLASGGGG